MAEFSEEDLSAFESDLDILLNVIKESFEADQIRHFIDPRTDTLYVEIDTLHEFSSEEIDEIGGEILSELDLDFDEVVFLPFER